MSSLDGNEVELLTRGDLLPHMEVVPPGPRSRELGAVLGRFEPPGANTVFRGQAAIAWHSALGANVVDVDGNRYIDFTSGFGVGAIGHRHPRVVAAMREQSERLVHGLGDVHPHPGRARLAERICGLVPVDSPRVFLGVSGSDAIEIALKSAILATGKSAIIAFERGYHGSSFGALAITGRATFREPFQAHLSPLIRRLPYGCAEDVFEDAVVDGQVAAVVVEPALGRGGCVFPPKGWLTMLASACKRHGVLLIADEIFTGFGRTGRWFACEHEDVRPDILCCGKAFAGGFPMAATVGRSEVMEGWRTDGECLHAHTFLANPIGCAAALAVIDVMVDDGLPARAAELGEHLAGRLDQLVEGWNGRAREAGLPPQIREIRGRGIMWAIETTSHELMARWGAEVTNRGVLLLAGGGVMRVDPPIAITMEQLDAALDILDEAFTVALVGA